MTQIRNIRSSLLTTTTTTTALLLLLCLLSTSIPAVTASLLPWPRIVGGIDAEEGEYSFFASWDGSCGATVLHDDILLTAAHCSPLTSTKVIIGAYTRDEAHEPPPVNSVTRSIQDKIIHPSFDAQTWKYDMMLLKLHGPVPEWIPRVELNNDPKIPADDSIVTAIGLGRLGEDGEGFPEVLQEVNVSVVDSDTCNSSPMYPTLIYEDTMICAAVENGGKDACFGDSGGPLMHDVDGVLKQVGIVSFGIGCARATKPGVYSRVSAGYDWIQEMICQHSATPPAHCLYKYQDSSALTENLPLGRCTGNCVTHSDCEEGLFCLSGDESGNFPGCIGNDKSGGSYCVEASKYLSVVETSKPSLRPSVAPSPSPSEAPSPQPYLRQSISSTTRDRIASPRDYVP